MFAIEMGGCDIVLGVEWLWTLGPITTNFHELYMSFQHEGHHYTFKGITIGSPEIINSHCMEKLLKKGHLGIVAQFHAIQAFETPSQPIHPNMQLVLAKHQSVFETFEGLPPSQGEHNHFIPFIPSSLPPNVCPYRHPFPQSK
jgi:hypothetical protein